MGLELDFDKQNGLITAVVQDVQDTAGFDGGLHEPGGLRQELSTRAT